MLSILGQSLFTLRILRAITCLMGLVCLQISNSAQAAEPLFLAPQPAPHVDEIILVSTRAAGVSCHSETLSQRLCCERFVGKVAGESVWQEADWRELLADSPEDRQTIIYVHGNRVGPGRDRDDGLEVFRSLKLQGNPEKPVRFIIWSWPSTPIPGPVKDFRLKATLTNPVAWQFAWFLDQLSSDTQLSLVGYSYGARVVSGAMHLLTGGQLGKLEFRPTKQHEPTAFRVALIAAAYNETWIRPGSYYGRTIAQTERLIITKNKQDPAMRFYHLSNGRGRVHALGRAGVENPKSLGPAAKRIKHIDFSAKVGRSHSLKDYLAATSKMGTLWHQLLTPAAERPVSRVASMLQLLPWVK